MLPAIFVMAGVVEIGDIQGAMGYMNAMGVPGFWRTPQLH